MINNLPIGELEFWAVDEVIECLDVSDDTGRELLRFAPRAYCGNGVAMSAIWEALPATLQATVLEAHRQSMAAWRRGPTLYDQLYNPERGDA